MRRPRSTSARWFIILFVLGGALLSALVACQAKPVWKGSVKIGLIVPFYGYDSGSANAAYFATKLALKERNESGGVGGQWVELVALDDQNNREVAARRARELVLDPDIMGVIGHLSSDTALGAAPVYREAGLVAITLGATATELALSYPEILRMAPDDALSATRALQTIAGRVKVRRIAVLHDASAGHSAAAEAFLAEAKRRKLDVAAVVQVEKVQRDFAPFLQALSSNPPQLLVFVGDQFQAAAFARQVRASPFHDIFKESRILIAGCASTPDFVKIGGEAANGVLHEEAVGLLDTAKQDRDGAGTSEADTVGQFVAHYRSLTGLSPTAYAFAAYDATVSLLSAMSKAAASDGNINRTSTTQEMRKAMVSAGPAASVGFGYNSGFGTGSIFGQDGGRRGVVPQLYEIDESGYPGRLWQ